MDEKNFTSILKNIDLLQKPPGQNTTKSNPNFTAKHLRYKKDLGQPKSYDTEDIPNYNIRKYSQQLVERNIDSDKFRNLLRQEGINPNIEGVK